MSLHRIGLAAFAAALLLAGCGELPVKDRGPSGPVDLSHVQEPTPRWEPRSKYGNPESYSVLGRTYQVMQDAQGYAERGLASWYGEKFHGRLTSTREAYDMYAMTAAHKTLPLPTYARVTNLTNGRSVIVRINDRGPFHDDRIIDLSYAAASRLGIAESGTAEVEVRTIDVGGPPAPPVEVMAQPGFRADAPLAAPIPLEPAAPEPVAVAVPPAPLLAATVAAAAPIAPAPAPAQPAPPPAATPAPERRLYLQVGAFASRDNAERLRATLSQSEAVDASVRETPHHTHGVLYRVQLGPLSPAEAEQMTPRLTALGLGRPQILSRADVEPPAEALAAP